MSLNRKQPLLSGLFAAFGSVCLALPALALQEPQKAAGTPASVLVFNQKPDGKTIKLTYANMPADGYVVVLDDAGGKPGHAIASMPLQAGDHRDIKFNVDKDLKAGSKYWVALYEEADKNGKFDDKDRAVWTVGQLPLQNMFEVL